VTLQKCVDYNAGYYLKLLKLHVWFVLSSIWKKVSELFLLLEHVFCSKQN